MQNLLAAAAQERSMIGMDTAQIEQSLNDNRIQSILQAVDKNFKIGEAMKWDRSAAKRGYWRMLPTVIGGVIGGIYGGASGASMGAQAGAKTGELIIPNKGENFWESSTDMQRLLAVGNQ